jgi:hypothetical protein
MEERRMGTLSRWSIAMLLVLLGGNSLCWAQRPAGRMYEQVFLQFAVFEVDLTKLEAIGVDMEAVEGKLDPETLEGASLQRTLGLLVEKGLAKRRAEPAIATVSGRTASFQVGAEEAGIRLNATPRVLESREIRSQVSIQLRESGTPGSSFALETSTDLVAGKPYCLARVNARRPAARGEVHDYCTFVILTADTEPPKNIKVAAAAGEIKAAPAAGAAR